MPRSGTSKLGLGDSQCFHGIDLANENGCLIVGSAKGRTGSHCLKTWDGEELADRSCGELERVMLK